MKQTINIAKCLCIFYLLFTSCLSKPQATLIGSNAKVKVELLFEIDGCKVYRFYDGNAVRYFTKCKDSANSSVGWDQSCGKYCTYYAEVMTSYEKTAPNNKMK